MVSDRVRKCLTRSWQLQYWVSILLDFSAVTLRLRLDSFGYLAGKANLFPIAPFLTYPCSAFHGLDVLEGSTAACLRAQLSNFIHLSWYRYHHDKINLSPYYSYNRLDGEPAMQLPVHDGQSHIHSQELVNMLLGPIASPTLHVAGKMF